jgi:RecA-family ATPase
MGMNIQDKDGKMIRVSKKRLNNEPLKRNHDLEKKIILMSKIELRLLATLREHQGPYSWLPDADKQSKSYLVDGYRIISKTHEINPHDDIMWVQQNLPMLKTYIDLLREAILKNCEAIKKPEYDFEGNENYDPDPRRDEPNKNIMGIINANVESLNNNISVPNKRFFGEIILPSDTHKHPLIFSDMLNRNPVGNFICFCLYLMINNLDEDSAISELMELENIDDDIFSTQGLFKRNSWDRSRFYNDWIHEYNFSTSKFIDFKSSTGRSAGKIEINNSKDGYVLLPVTQWYKRGDERPFHLHLPFGKDVPLYNLDLICKNKSARIIISENLLWTNFQSNAGPHKNMIYTSWPNWPGENSLKYVNIKHLLDRKVIYDMGDGHDKVKTYAKAMKNYVYLKDISDLVFCEHDPDHVDGHIIHDREEFLNEARKLGVQHASDKIVNANQRLSLHSAVEDCTVQEMQFIIEPIIPEKSIILLYSDFGVGKSFAALSWAYGVGQGCDICERLKVKKNRKVLYIDSEMGEEIMKERIGYMKKIFGDAPARTGDFLWHSVASENQIQNINIAEESGQNIIEELLDLALQKGEVGEPVSFLILDNISTLTSGISNHSSWMKVFKWLYKLKSKCSVLILHHENRAGKYLGSVLQGITVDSKIHLLAPELKTREIEFDVIIDKARRTYGKAKAPFTTGIDINSTKPKWTTFSGAEIAEKEKFKDMSQKERIKYLKVLKDKLGNNENIANFLGISLATLYNWKKELK